MLGIDIGSSSIKVAELYESGGKLRLENAGEAMLPHDAIVNKAISRRRVISGVLSNLLSELEVRERKAVISVSGSGVMCKVIRVPGSFLGKRKNMDREALRLVKLHLSENLDGINYSYVPLEGEEDDSEIYVMLAVAPKKMVRSYKWTALCSGLFTKVVYVDSLALSEVREWGRDRYVNQKVMLVDIGASMTNMNVVRGGTPFVLADIPLGGSNVTFSMMERFGISYEEAEKRKRAIASSESEWGVETSGFMADFVSRLVREIRAVLNKAGDGVGCVILSGGCCEISGFKVLIEKTFGVPVEFSNPFKSVVFDESRFDPEYLDFIAPRMAVAVGLAARGLRTVRENG